MTRQVLDLTELSDEGWRGAVPIDPALIEGGGTAYLRHIRRIGNSLQVRLAANETDRPEDAGPEFTAALETSARAFIFADGTDTLVLKGSGHEDNTFADQTEPYFWTPDNTAEFTAWFGSTHQDFTLTLDDGVLEHAVRGGAEAGAPNARARVDAIPALALADFDAEGLQVDVLALIRAGAGPANTVYAVPPRGSVGALVEGELGLGAGDAPITRIRRRNGNMLVVNDNDSLSLTGYFNPGGPGADLTLYIQTRAGVASLAVIDHGREGSDFIQFGPLGTDLQALLDGIAEGDLFIFALARPARTVIELRGAAEAGAAEAAARVSRVEPAVRTPQGTAASGEADASAGVRAWRVRAVRGVAAAGEASALARLAPIAVRAIRGRARAGRPRARAHVAAVTIRTMRGEARAGGAEVLTQLLVAETAVLYRRALRESAPADRLLTALEISHPAIARPVRVVNDTQGRRIEGNDYVALRFDARLADDIAGQAPQAELSIDNIGRELTQWIEAAGGGIGATVRVMLVLGLPDSPVEWEVTLDVAGMSVDQERVTARLGFDPLFGGSAVTLRHDPQTSPGLF